MQNTLTREQIGKLIDLVIKERENSETIGIEEFWQATLDNLETMYDWTTK